MKFPFFIIISLALLATLPDVFGKPLLNAAAGKNGALVAFGADNADNDSNRFRRNADLTVTGSAGSSTLNHFSGTVDAEFSRAARSQTLDKWQVIFRKVKNQAAQAKLEEELATNHHQTTAPGDYLDEELKNAAVTAALTFRSDSGSTELPSEEAAIVEAAKKSTEEHKKTSLMTAIRIMKLQNISPDIIYSIVQNYQDDPERLMAILTSNKI